MKRVAVLMAVLLVALAAPSYAGDHVIRSVTASHTELSLVVTVPPASRSALRITIDGQAVAPSLRGGAAIPKRSAMLLLDESGSMQGEPIRQAVAAARAFSSAVPADVSVGLVGFGDLPHVLLDPSRDRGRLDAALHGVRAGGNTTLYDAVLLALRRLGGTGARSIVLLSDGDDTRSTAGLAQVTAAVAKADVQLQVIRLAAPQAKLEPLQELARAGHGSVVGVSSARNLPRAFRTAADALRDTVIMTVPLPAGLAGKQVTIAVDFPRGAARMHDEAVLLIPAAGAVTEQASGAPEPSAPQSDRALNAVFAAALVFLGLFGLTNWLLTSPARDRKRRTQLIAAYTARAAAPAAPNQARPGVLLRLAEAWGRRSDRAALAEKLQRAGIDLSPGEWLVRQIALGLSTTILLTLALNLIAGIVLGLLVSLLGFRLFLQLKARRRLGKFQADLPDSLQLVASSLSAGYSLPQALDAVVQEGSEPLAGEFGRALAEARIGVPVEDALDDVATRVGSEDFRWVVLSIRIQRSTGGNLSEVLLTVSKTMRDRAAMRRQVKALSAEGRLSAYLLIGLPIVLALYEFTLRRAYMRPLYTSGLGIAMIVMAVLGVIVGSLWMRKIINVGD